MQVKPRTKRREGMNGIDIFFMSLYFILVLAISVASWIRMERWFERMDILIKKSVWGEHYKESNNE